MSGLHSQGSELFQSGARKGTGGGMGLTASSGWGREPLILYSSHNALWIKIHRKRFFLKSNFPSTQWIQSFNIVAFSFVTQKTFHVHVVPFKMAWAKSTVAIGSRTDLLCSKAGGKNYTHKAARGAWKVPCMNPVWTHYWHSFSVICDQLLLRVSVTTSLVWIWTMRLSECVWGCDLKGHFWREQDHHQSGGRTSLLLVGNHSE